MVSVAAGQSLSFADSSSATWGEGRVAFECAEGATVRFGDSGDALTRAQLRRIRLNGEKVVLDESGALMPRGKTGFRLILR